MILPLVTKPKGENRMKNVLKGLCVAALTASLAHAGDEKDLKKIIEDQGIYVETAQKGIVLSGYVDTSYTYQFAGAPKGINSNPLSGPQTTLREGGNVGVAPSTENVGRSFDVNNNSFNLNAVKLTLEKALSDKVEYTAGFRADLMFGEDAGILNGNATANKGGTATATNIDSQFFLEQAYVNFRVPVGNGLDFKVGKFVTLLGYEIIESPGNINFSRGLLFTNAIPLTHTGILASYKFNDIVDAQFGFVNGWNNGQADTAGIQGVGKAITGRVAVNAPGGNATIANSFIYSMDGEPGTTSSLFTENGGPVFLWDIWGQWYPTFVKDKALLLAFNVDLGFAENAQADNVYGGPAVANTSWWGAALYAKYQFTKVFSLGARGEYLHGDNILKFGGVPVPGTNASFGPATNPFGSVDIWSWTLTAGFNIWENLLTRVEYRYDLSKDNFINGCNQQQIAVNLVYSF